MRRKSERTKEKEKSSPEKKGERPTRRSRRHSRRSMRSTSVSPERVESGTEENEAVIVKSGQDDVEEEHPAPVEETSSQVGAVITADPVCSPEVDVDNQTVSSRTRKSRKHNVETASQEESQPSTTKADVTTECEWKEDNTFWQEGDPKLETEDTKHKEKGSRSPVWKVKSSDGGGGEIQKLKLCIVRPPETQEPIVKKKKRLRRNSANQMKENVDENDSSKGSQGEEDKLSSDEKVNSLSCQSEREEENKSTVDYTSQDSQITSNEMVTNIADVGKEKDDEQVENETCKIELESKSDRSDEEEKVEEIIEEDKEKEGEDKEKEGEDKEKEGEDKEKVGEDKEKEGEDKEKEGEDKEKEGGDKEKEGEDKKKESEDKEKEGEEREQEEHSARGEEETEETMMKESNESTETSEECNANISTVSYSVVSPEPDISSIAEPECDTECVQADSEPISEDSAHPMDEIQKSPPSSKEVLISHSPNVEEKDSPLSNPEVECEETNDNETSDNLKENSGRSVSVQSPKDCPETVASVPEDNVEVRDRSVSSEDEKEIGSGNSSPRFKHRSADRIHKKERSTGEYEPRNSANSDSGKHSRHLERRNHSPRRKEKISLRRSFSGKFGESEESSSTEVKIKVEKINDVTEDQNVHDKENNLRRLSGAESATGVGNVMRKRRWGQSNSSRPSKKPVLSISTDSLKTLIPGAKLVPITEVQLVQDEEIKKEKDVWDYDKDLDREKLKTEHIESAALDKKAAVILTDAPRISVALTDDHESKVITRKISIVSDDARTLQKSPSPARHRATNVLFITNLVRPFTVNQLRELLARTGKIVDGGFWIDKIKSKCYVEYETETEAKETRHALHGVRWPVSNPKTLCVDFGRKEDMEMAQAVAESDLIPRKTEPLKVERNLDGWVVEPAREKELEKISREHEREKEREYERDRIRGKERNYHTPMEIVDHHKKVAVREWDLGKLGQLSPERESHYDDKIKEKEKKIRKEKPRHSRSISPHDNPVRKVKKKEEDAPAKLLDDLFRKTKTTPCIYWLPLTAEQIVVKEEMRRKHMAEHERRMAEMRKAERERERVRAQQRQHRRVNEREKRRRRSGSASPKK